MYEKSQSFKVMKNYILPIIGLSFSQLCAHILRERDSYFLQNNVQHLDLAVSNNYTWNLSLS